MNLFISDLVCRGNDRNTFFKDVHPRHKLCNRHEFHCADENDIKSIRWPYIIFTKVSPKHNFVSTETMGILPT